jgi:Rhodopirellula transposase DDE domain
MARYPAGTQREATIEAVLDTNNYATKKQATDEQFRSINIHGDEFHPEWNYTIRPQT